MTKKFDDKFVNFHTFFFHYFIPLSVTSLCFVAFVSTIKLVCLAKRLDFFALFSFSQQYFVVTMIRQWKKTHLYSRVTLNWWIFTMKSETKTVPENSIFNGMHFFLFSLFRHEYFLHHSSEETNRQLAIVLFFVSFQLWTRESHEKSDNRNYNEVSIQK